MVLDLEDAVDDMHADAAMHNVVTALDELAADPLATMVFVRVRSYDCIPKSPTDLQSERML